jgi:hypothetical protein
MPRRIPSGLAILTSVAGFVLAPALRAEDPPQTQPARASAAEGVHPKPLSSSVKKGLEYLIKQQHANGGWGQGGGWRTIDNGSRIEGSEVKDPPDVGNTCIAVLALIRAGNTAKDGPYSKEVAKAVEFVCGYVAKSDDKSLYVTDVKGTQIQTKIGPYVDTFLTSMVLAELKGKMPDEKSEKLLVASLDKTIAKVEKNQNADGTFAGNQGWATVLSQGLANKGLARAAQSGASVQPQSLDRIQGQVASNFDEKSKTFKPAEGGGAGGYPGPADAKPISGTSKADPSYLAKGGARMATTSPAAGPSDAGVRIYGTGQNLTNIADVVNTLKLAEKKAKETLSDKKAPKEEREKAEQTLKRVDEARKLQDEATKGVVKQLEDPSFVQGFGSNGGEEFLSYMNISEALLLKGGAEWKKWDQAMTESLTRIQDGDGSWSGHHCITGKTFCTAAALLVLMADRAPLPAVTEAKK